MLGLGLTRYLPPALRGPVRWTAERMQRLAHAGLLTIATQRRPAPRTFSGRRIAVLGFIEAPTGLGRGARLMLAEFAATGAEARGFDAAPLLERARRREARAMIDALAAYAPTDIVMHLNPPMFENAYLRLPTHVHQASAIVGYWAWELNRLPTFWVNRTSLCDEIWAPSPFVADAVRASAPSFKGAVRVWAHPVARDPFPKTTPEQRAAARAKLDLPAESFVAGVSFSMASNYARKNPLAAVRAFEQAFPRDDANARLLIRMLDPDDYPNGAVDLHACAKADPRVRILTRSDASIGEFYQALDVLVSLHRSEGYGLNIAEATQAGLDVVATGWSISPELLTPNVRAVGAALVPISDPQGVYNGIEGATWAEPNIDVAAAALRALRLAR